MANKTPEGSLGPRGFSERMLGPRPDQRAQETGAEAAEAEAPFEERSEAEQVDLLYTIHDLVDRRSLLTKDIKASEKERHALPTYDIKRVSGAFIAVPIPEEPTEHTLYDKTVIAQAKEELGAIESKLKELGAIPGMHEAYEKRLKTWNDLIRCVQVVDRYRARMVAIDATVDDVTAHARAKSRTGKLTGVAAKQVAALQAERSKLADDVDHFDKGSLETGLDQNVLQQIQYLGRLKNYTEAWDKGEIVEFPSAREIREEVMQSMERREPRLLAGHLGAGKTELAKHCAKLFMIKHGIGFDATKAANVDELYRTLEPEFFSGAEEASTYDLLGKLKLKPGAGESDLRRKVDEAKKSLGPDSKLTDDDIAQQILARGEVVGTYFEYGPVGRAIRDGKPVIIDEINRIPSEVLSRLNNYLIARVGTTVSIQENGKDSFEVKPGFVFLATGNIGPQYEVKKQELAQKGRWTQLEVGYPKLDETYDLIMSALMRKDRVRLPPSFPMADYEKLGYLALATNEVQDIFSGQTQGLRYMAMQSGMGPESAPRGHRMLERATVSTRDLMRKVIEDWEEGNFKKSLDEVVAQKIIKPEIENKLEQKFMAEVFMRNGMFEGWDAAKFKKYGVEISDQEINTLQAVMQTDAYKKANEQRLKLKEEIQEKASMMRANLGIGTGEIKA